MQLLFPRSGSPRRPGRLGPGWALWLAGLAASGFLAISAGVAAPADSVRRVRSIDPAETGVARPVGLAYSRRADGLLVAGRSARGAEAEVALVGRDGPPGARRLGLTLADPINLAFDNKAHRLLGYDTRSQRLVQVPAGRDGVPKPRRRSVLPAGHYEIGDAQGLTVDPVTGRVYLLDVAGPRLVVVEPAADGGLPGAAVSSLALAVPGPLRGLAFDPSSGHLHVMAPAGQRLYEVDAAGTIVANRDLAGLELHEPQGMVFAPSGDGTDDPLQQSLYVAGAGAPSAGGEPTGEIAEFTLTVAAAGPSATSVTASLVQQRDASNYNPPSPDSMGITYLDHRDTLLMSDSEVNEISSLFTGDNIFEITETSR
jgi:hypothetical protein